MLVITFTFGSHRIVIFLRVSPSGPKCEYIKCLTGMKPFNDCGIWKLPRECFLPIIEKRGHLRWCIKPPHKMPFSLTYKCMFVESLIHNTSDYKRRKLVNWWPNKHTIDGMCSHALKNLKNNPYWLAREVNVVISARNSVVEFGGVVDSLLVVYITTTINVTFDKLAYEIIWDERQTKWRWTRGASGGWPKIEARQHNAIERFKSQVPHWYLQFVHIYKTAKKEHVGPWKRRKRRKRTWEGRCETSS